MTDSTPEYLIPRVGRAPVSSVRSYRTATITKVIGPGSTTKPVAAPLTVPRPSAAMAGAPLEGVLLTHEQSWRLAGIALGSLVHSVSLAPGEITQIAVENRSAAVHERSVDQGLQAEARSSTTDASSAQTDTERTTATDQSSGSTIMASSGMSMQAAAGGLLGLFGVSGGMSANLVASSQAAVNTGHRSVADEANQALHQAATDQARLSRARHTAAVREVSETDEAKTTTRVLANYNHMHALNMQYYEVEQVLQLRTRVTRAERLLFVPMRRIDFSDPGQLATVLQRYRDELIATTRDLGLDALAAKLVLGRLGLSGTTLSVATLDERKTSLNSILDGNRTTLETARQTAIEAQDAEREAVDAVNGLEATAGLAERGKRLRTRATAEAEARQADDAVVAAAEAVAAAEQRLAEVVEARRQVDLADDIDDIELGDLLQHHGLAINQGLWLRLEPATVSAMLRNRVHQGAHLGRTIDPTPVAVSGDYVGFRWPFDDAAAEEQFSRPHLDADIVEHSVTVPTGGLFGEAVLGESIGAERIDLTRFWNWSDALPPLRPTAIEGVGAELAAPLAAPTAAAPPDAHLDLGQVHFPATGSAVPSLAAALANPELFRDLSGQQATAAMAQLSVELASQGASEAAELASQNYQRFLQFQRAAASAVLDTVKRAGELDPTLAGGALNAKENAGKGTLDTVGKDFEGPPPKDTVDGTGAPGTGETTGGIASETTGGAPGDGAAGDGKAAPDGKTVPDVVFDPEEP